MITLIPDRSHWCGLDLCEDVLSRQVDNLLRHFSVVCNGVINEDMGAILNLPNPSPLQACQCHAVSASYADSGTPLPGQFPRGVLTPPTART